LLIRYPNQSSQKSLNRFGTATRGTISDQGVQAHPGRRHPSRVSGPDALRCTRPPWAAVEEADAVGLPEHVVAFRLHYEQGPHPPGIALRALCDPIEQFYRNSVMEYLVAYDQVRHRLTLPLRNAPIRENGTL